MSTEHENTETFPFECIFGHFKRQKVAISHAIRTTFPFLEGLRDNDLITGKMYEVSEIYYTITWYLERGETEASGDVSDAEVKLDQNKYPDLRLICKSFENVLPNELYFQGSDGGDPNSQLSLEQGPSGTSSQGSLTWSPVAPSSTEGLRSDDRRNSGLMQENQTENPQLSESQNHRDSCELQVQLRAVRLNRELQINPCFVHLVDIKKENSPFPSDGNQQARARINQNGDSGVIELSSGDSDDGENFSEASTSVPSQPAPAYSRNLPTQRTYRRGDTSDTDSSITIKGRKRTGHAMDVGNNRIQGKDGRKRRKKRERHGNYLIRNIKIPSWKTVFLARSTNPSSQRGRKRGRRIPRDENADFRETELPVTCGNIKGTLHKEKFKQGIYVRSIKSETGRWLTPMEFEIEGNREKSKNWRQSIRCKGWTLKELIKKGELQDPPRKKKETPPNPRQTERQLENPKACKICGQRRKLYPCATCRQFYHKNCHIPPVEDTSSAWHCAFCKTKNQLRCQKDQARYKEAEVLKRKMSPEEQLKCELLLLTIYRCPKSGFFIPKPKQRKEDFPDIKEHMWLNKIKNRLNKKAYHSVQRFVRDVRLVFQNHSIFYKNKFKNLGVRVGNKFEETFKRIFSIEETSKEHQPCKHTVLLT
ncbi:nuclear autoantigen Sp-100-like [Mastomys coucha]|uniref:nuclear autoantigen Sp-100-like n=1 Tax=Mastomys coucha TaxID=35658 RepID=UPI0012617F79|nr:nuclear autoantigen Sp-100-like [Mastomys coucha]